MSIKKFLQFVNIFLESGEVGGGRLFVKPVGDIMAVLTKANEIAPVKEVLRVMFERKDMMDVGARDNLLTMYAKWVCAQSIVGFLKSL